MSDNSAIEWTDATWNPIAGCSIVSPGCTNCYAMREAARIEAMFAGTTGAQRYRGTTKRVNGNAVWTGNVALASDAILAKPLRWKKPRMIFVNSMSDLFHQDVPDEWIDKVFAVMALSPQHTFQALTKRAERMCDYWSSPVERFDAIERQIEGLLGGRDVPSYSGRESPLPNVWLGVSAERQEEADERIPLLLQTPAAIRFVSLEPLLGPIDLRRILVIAKAGAGPDVTIHALRGWYAGASPDDKTKLDWVIVGGESGPKARPMHPQWARNLRDQCATAGVLFFFKQWGAWKDGSDFVSGPSVRAVLTDGRVVDPDLKSLGEADRIHTISCRNATLMRRVGKKKAGRLLDGVEHNGFPEARA